MPKSRKRMKKLSQPPKTAQEAALQRMLHNGVFNGQDVEVRRNAGAKMSELLLDVIAPLTDAARNLEEFHKAVMIGMVAWNGAIQETGTSTKVARKIAEIMKLTDDRDVVDIVAFLIKRKRLLYPNNKRLILNYDAQDTPQGFFLNVLSLPEGEQANSESSALPGHN